MERKYINRTVGIVVVLAIIVLVAPSLFNRHQNTPKVQAYNSPPMPVIKKAKVFQPVVTKPKNITPEKAWVVQVGSFKNPANAKKLIGKLKLKKYKTFAYKAHGLTRVFVGPEIEEKDAKALQAQLKSKLSLTGLVKPFDVRDI